MWRIIASRPLRMERRGELVEVEGEPVWLVRASSPRHQPGKSRQTLHEIDLAGVVEPAEVRSPDLGGPGAEAREDFCRITE